MSRVRSDDGPLRRGGRRRDEASPPPLWLYAAFALVLTAGTGFAARGRVGAGSGGAASMVRLRVLPLAQWGFGRAVGVKVPVPRPPGTTGVPAAYRAAGFARWGGPGPPLPRTVGRGGGGWRAARYRLVFAGRREGEHAISPDGELRTLFIARPRHAYRRAPAAPVGAPAAYHELHLPPGASISEGVLSRLATEGDGWRLGPVVVVWFDPILAVPE